MTSALVVLWWVSWRYRVRPSTADQHAHGTHHTHYPVQTGLRGDWYCLQCPMTSTYRPPWGVREWALTVLAVVLSVGLLVLGVLTGRLVGWLL